MKRKILKITGVLAIILILFLFAGYKLAYKPHRNVAVEAPAYELKTSKFINEFKTNTTAASDKYLNKVILLSGDVSEIDSDGITVDESVYAQFDTQKFEKLSNGKTVRLKGRCIGYDDLLETIKLDQCVILD